MIRHLCRALMAGVFIYSGLSALIQRVRGGDAPAEDADAVSLPGVPDEQVETVLLASSAVQLVGGSMLLMDRAPRTTALALAGSLLPSTIGEHAFWSASPGDRDAELRRFLTNMALFGGLAITALDTEGRPGVAWRAGQLAKHAADEAEWRRREAELLAQVARYRASAKAQETRAAAADVRHRAQSAASDVVNKAQVESVRLQGRTVQRARQALVDANLAQKATRTVGGLLGGVVTGVGKALTTLLKVLTSLVRGLGAGVSSALSSRS